MPLVVSDIRALVMRRPRSFDHPRRLHQDRLRDREPERLRGPQV
jgi:hypothetical protein